MNSTCLVGAIQGKRFETAGFATLARARPVAWQLLTNSNGQNRYGGVAPYATVTRPLLESLRNIGHTLK